MTRRTNPILLGAEAPRVLTVPMIAAALADRRRPMARGTLFRWIKAQTESSALRSVTRGLYLNQLAQPLPNLSEAAGYVRSGAIDSLQTVLGEAGVTNNYPDIVTAVLPIFAHRSAHSSRSVVAPGAEFRFHAMPARLLDERAGFPDDRLDADSEYARATPEKALLDWIYLGNSRFTRLSGPPLDMDFSRVDSARLTRLATRMNLKSELKSYLIRKRQHDRSPDVMANAPIAP